MASNVCITPIAGDCVVRQCGGHLESGGWRVVGRGRLFMTFLPTVDKAIVMVGSYGPRAQEYEFVTSVEEAPRGALARGLYVVRSLFTDDDRLNHLSWEWRLHVCQDWKD